MNDSMQLVGRKDEGEILLWIDKQKSSVGGMIRKENAKIKRIFLHFLVRG